MPSVGTAYVNIRINTKGFESGLDKMLARLSTKMKAGGKKLGDDFVKGLESSNTEKFFRDMELRAQKASTKMSGDLKKVERSLDNVGLTASDAGDMFDSSFARTSSTLQNTRQDLRAVENAVKDVERSGRGASSSLSNIGSGSSGFRSAARDVGFFGDALDSLSAQGVAARAWLSQLHDYLAFQGTAAAVAVGGLSAAAQGVFALGAQAASTAPALGILASGMIGLAQVGGVMAISMHGVGEALKAGFDSTTKAATAAAPQAKALDNAAKSALNSAKAAVEAARRAVEAARRGIRDALQGIDDAARGVQRAKQDLQDAYRDAARAAAEASRRTSAAERDLASAQRDSAAAQKDLNLARAEALEQMEDIAFAAEDASLAEDRAALSLADAHQELLAVSELAPDDRARVEAELAYKEAELNMRQAKDRREDADKEQKKIAKSGIEGTDAMKSARDNLASAHEKEAGAQEDLNDARRDEVKVAEDNARRIQDAQQGVADAQRGMADAQQALADAQRDLADAQQRLADAGKRQNDALHRATPAATAAATALDKYKEALKKLSPNQRAFVKRLIELGPVFRRARNQIADPLFGGLLDGLNTVVGSPFWGQLVNRLTGTSTVLGDLVRKAADTATKPPFSTALFSTMGNNNKVLKNFGAAAINLASAFVQVADAAGPTLLEFSKWVKSVTASWNQTAILKNKTDELDGTISRAGDRVAEFKDLFVALWDWLRKVGGAAFEASNNFKWLDKKGDKKTGYIPMMTENLKEFTKTIDKNANITRFTTALDTLAKAGKALKVAVIDPLLSMGGDKRFGDSFDIISQNKQTFQDLADTAGEAGPALATLVVNALDLFNALSRSGSLAHFLDDVGKFVGFIGDLVELVPVPVLKAIGTALGAIAAIRFVGGIGKKLAAAFIPPGLDKIPGKIRGAAGKAVNAGIAMEDAGFKVALKFEQGFGAGMKEVAVQSVRAVKAALPKTGLITAGFEFARGIAVGIEDAAPAVILSVEAMAKSMISAMKATLGIKSPSTVAMANGLNFSEAFAMGISEGAPAAEAAAAKMSVGAAEGLGAGKAVAGAEGAAMSAGAAGGIGGAAGGQVGKIGKFAGVMGKFSKVLGPASKLLKPLSLGIRAVGFAFRFALGPIGMIVLTVLPLLWPLLVKLEEKTGIFSKSLDVLKKGLGKVAEGFKWLWDKIKELFDWVKTNWPLLLAIIAGPFGLAVYAVVKNFDKIVNFVKGVPAKIGRFLSGMWNSVSSGLSKVWKRVVQIWNRIVAWVKGRPAQFVRNLKALWNIFQTGLSLAYRKVVQIWSRVTTWVKGRPAQFKRNLKLLWDVFRDRLSAMWTAVGNIWSRIITWLKGRPGQFKRILATLWDQFKTGLGAAWTWVKDKWKDIKAAVANWKSEIAGSLKHIFDGMGRGLVAAINWVGDKVNWMIGKLNDILDKFNAPNITVSWPTLRWGGFPGLAEGGPVHGPGGPKGDKVIRRLSDNEHVWTAREVASVGGHRNMAAMRKAALRGGMVGPGGIGIGGSGGSNNSSDDGGGIIGWIKDKVGSLGDALKKGYEYAFKWVLSKFKGEIGIADTIPKKMALGMFEWAATKITGLGKREDVAAAAAASAAASSSGSGPAAVWRALRSVGYSKVQTAGVMGNMQSESGFDPFIVQGGGHSLNPAAAGGGGYGLVQWTPGRKLIPYLHGKRPSINAEITALAAQLAGRGSSPERAAGIRLKAADTVAEAALAFELGYERHAGGPQPSRISQAVNWYKRFSSSDAASAAAPSAYTGPPGSWVYVVPSRTHTYNFPGHNPSSALDLGVGVGTPVRAMTSGVVESVSGSPYSHESYGYWIVLSHKNGWKTLYAHMSRIIKKRGGRVSPGTLIGYSGASGDVSGKHLHLELTKNTGSYQSTSTHTRADQRGVRWPYRYGGAWAKGGVIGPQSNGAGVLALLAEAGKAERVTPLDREGFTPAERKMLEALENRLGGGGGDSYHVHSAPGMNETALADKVARRVAWNRRRGAGWR